MVFSKVDWKSSVHKAKVAAIGSQYSAKKKFCFLVNKQLPRHKTDYPEVSSRPCQKSRFALE